MHNLLLKNQPSIALIQQRLTTIFPQEFPNRAILVGEMASRLISVCLYGNFINTTDHYFRPSTIIRFTLEQLEQDSTENRIAWLSICQTSGYKTFGNPWYAENTRETLRDDLIKNKMIPMGIIIKKQGVPPTSPAPIYQLSSEFAQLFDPTIVDKDLLSQQIDTWQKKFLDKGELRRMHLLAKVSTLSKENVQVSLPNTGKSLMLAPGDASVITKSVCEVLATKLFTTPWVIWISMSDEKQQSELAKEVEAFNLEIDKATTLPDVLILDVDEQGQLKMACIEVVHSDGPITELRKAALIELAISHDIKEENITLISAFSDRNSPSFRKRFSELASNTKAWFSSEPNLLLEISEF